MMNRGEKDRPAREREHGLKLAAGDPEKTWGWKTPAGQVRASRRANLISRRACLAPGVLALEIGCGTGIFTELFSRTGAGLVAVDISPDLLEQARKRNLPSMQVRFLEKRFENCGLEGPFDAVIGSSVLHHLEMDTALPQIFALLKPGGFMSFTEPNMLNPQIFLQKKIPWLKRWLGDSPDETAFLRWQIYRLLQREGFEQIEVQPFDWLHPATPKRWIPAVSGLGEKMEKLKMIRELAGSLHISARKPLMPSV